MAEAEEFAEHLMEEVLENERLTCSIGRAPNKLVARIASDYMKPYGLTAVKPEDVKDFLFPVKARKIPGVGYHVQALILMLRCTSEVLKTNNVWHYIYFC
ncbi:MAG TPA: hypothetical protein VN455_07845 [Methanotrichaceae archaeon]|nr:hypothetical protein [Methanotrichaceae archaeon]